MSKTHRTHHYIGGVFTPAKGSGIDVIDAYTEKVYGTAPAGSAADVDAAVVAARAAFPAWSQTSLEERSKFLRRIYEGLMARTDEIAELISHEVGMPIAGSKMIQAGFPPKTFETMADLAMDFEFERQVGNSLIVREPIGVVGAITPWNYPLNQVCWKVAPALAVGCTVILKPTEVAPLSAGILAEVMDEVGLPAGVFNVVFGDGPVVGEAIAAHPDVDMVSFTGSTRAGRRVSELAAGTIKRVALELGGKSANVILDDADFATVVPAGVMGAFMNSGQTCSALTRMLVPRSRLAEVEELAAAAVANIRCGDPFADGTTMGPVVSEVQLGRVRSYIQAGIDAGAKVVTGGLDQPVDVPHGYFVAPTVFSEVTRDMSIAREEIFGPVLSILPYDTEEEAVEIANDTVYGLSGAVQSGDPERARRVARQLRTGQVSINGGRGNAQTPFGGYRQSGNGRELGEFGLEEFLEVKALLMD